MYHCHIQFYLLSRHPGIFDPLRQIPPLERFTHTFTAGGEVDLAQLARADVVLADVQDRDARAVLDGLLAGRKRGAELIFLARRDQEEQLAERLPEGCDIWTAPLSQPVLCFRFRQWQRGCKQRKDFWLTSQYLEACIDSSPNLIWYKTKDGVHEKVNASFCRAVGKTKQQVQGQRHAYIWNVAEDDPACIDSEALVMRKKQTRKSEEVVRTGAGEKLLTTYKSPLYDLDGSVMGTVGVALDVTRERAYERAIVEKNQTLEMLFSTMDCGVMCHSTDGKRVVRINQAALHLLGYETEEELLDDGFDMVANSVVDEDKPKLRACIRSLRRPGDSTSVEYSVHHADGRLLHILGNVKLIEEGGELFYQRFLLDFTAQKLQEEEKWAQRDQELKYQEKVFEVFSLFLSNNIDDIYMMLDETGRKVEFVSTNVERVLGVPQKLLEEDLERLGKADYLSGESITYEDLRTMQPGASLELLETERVNQKTGEHKWFQESVYCVAVQRKKKLVVYISDRTKERMTQKTLSDALDMAKVASKAKSTFLGNVSHDIRTPMNAIMGFVTLLKQEANDPERVLEYTQKISAASQHLLGLINDMLDMNKIESGIAMLNISELDLADVIDEMNTIIRPQARGKGQEFEIFTSFLSYEHLLGDKLRINQILINILSNAVKYTPYGGHIEMRVSELPQVDQKYSRIQFTISDNGQGMSEEYQKVIFDPFTREQNTAWNKIQGTGLGMAITKSLVDLMNGSIKVTSKLGEGSTFVVELELRIQEKEADPKFWERHNIARMIVADDDQDICHDIVKKMEGTGVITQHATSGVQAVEMIRSAREAGRPYDLILLDWKMPDLDGLETARLIRKNYPDKTPILLFTAYDWNEIEQEALEVGIEHFLPKPFFMSNFKETIQRMMGTPKAAESAGDKESVVQGKHILVVDDIDVNRMILVKILTSLGARCDTAEDGKQAVDIFTGSPPGDYDIILMDIQMPNMNGHEATRAIRASGHPSAQSVAILAMTANAFVDDIRDALDAGMDAHVAKPIVLDQLKSSIREVLDRKRQQGLL